MNARFAPRSIRWLLLFLFALGCLTLFSAGVLAGEGPVVAPGSLHANFLFEVVADRARMIQMSLVMVALGIGLIWWTR